MSAPRLAVVGAGPAGLAAALAAADLGGAVTLIDAGAAAGGQIFRPSLVDGGPGSNPGIPLRLPPRLRRALRHDRIGFLPGTSVWHAERAGSGGGFVLRLAPAAGRGPPDTPAALSADAVVLATGSCELVLPFPGWDLPGVTTAGAAQALLKGQGVSVGRRVVVAGSGPLLLPAAAGLAAAGVRVVAVLEATAATALAGMAVTGRKHPAKLWEAARYAAVLARHRVPVLPGHAVVAGEGRQRVERAVIARLDRDWRPRPGTRRALAVDAVHVSFGFSPALELARLLGCADDPDPGRPVAVVRHDADQATTTAGVFAAGEITGIGGADVAELEGYLAGAAAARHLGLPAAGSTRLAAIRVRLEHARRFATLLDRGYPLRAGWLGWPAPDTIACRCEDVPWAAIGRAVAAGARDVRAVKGLTRCGMGYCQARVCGPAVQYAVAAAAGRPLGQVGDLHARPIVTPVPLGLIATEARDQG